MKSIKVIRKERQSTKSENSSKNKPIAAAVIGREHSPLKLLTCDAVFEIDWTLMSFVTNFDAKNSHSDLPTKKFTIKGILCPWTTGWVKKLLMDALFALEFLGYPSCPLHPADWWSTLRDWLGAPFPSLSDKPRLRQSVGKPKIIYVQGMTKSHISDIFINLGYLNIWKGGLR